MFSSKQYLKLLLLVIVLQIFNCLRIIPERAEVLFANESFVDNVTLNVRRYSRKGQYVINFVFTNKVTLGNDIMIDFNFRQYLHNEYRRSFVEMHYHICDLIDDDQWIGPSIRKAGLTTCPIPPGTTALTNLSFIHLSNFNYVWPFEKGLVEFVVYIPKTEVTIGRGLIVETFKQDLAKKQQ